MRNSNKKYIEWTLWRSKPRFERSTRTSLSRRSGLVARWSEIEFRVKKWQGFGIGLSNWFQDMKSFNDRPTAGRGRQTCSILDVAIGTSWEGFKSAHTWYDGAHCTYHFGFISVSLDGLPRLHRDEDGRWRLYSSGQCARCQWDGYGQEGEPEPTLVNRARARVGKLKTRVLEHLKRAV